MIPKQLFHKNITRNITQINLFNTPHTNMESTQTNQPESNNTQDESGQLKYFEFTEDMKTQAEDIINADSKAVGDFWYNKHEKDAKRNWDIFYKNNKTNFFKDRHYIDREFSELSVLKDSDKTYTFCEMGCGVGNAFFPLVERFPNLVCYGFDFSPRAIQMIKESELYKQNQDRIFAEVVDLVLDPIPDYFVKPDFATLIFVLSAISPENHEKVVEKISNFMKSGTVLMFRDYGRYDMAQLKLASQKVAKLKDNFYVKADGTRVYYFTKEEIRDLFVKFGFEEIENDFHYRMVENRKEDLKMHRVWLQAKFRKL